MSSFDNKTASQQIDGIIKMPGDWRGEILAQLRAVILQADPDIVEEVKWKKPSKPEGVPVWSLGGNICIGEMLKEAVRLTFPKGAQLGDAEKLFNARLDSKSIRAIDFHEGDTVNGPALQMLVREARTLNDSKST